MTKTAFYLAIAIFLLLLGGFGYFFFKSKAETAKNEKLAARNQQLEREKQQLLQREIKRIKPKVREPNHYH